MTLQYSTNLEAALEILKLEKEPMHYKRITELAIERKLLPPASDARKTPDQTMYTELYRSVKSAEQKNSIPNFKLLGKGIFSLHPLYRSEIIQRDTQGLTPLQNIQKIVEEQNKKIHRELLQLLLSMNPYSFEQVCGAYFKEMGYQDVDVTKRSNDGGVDVIANVKLGINEMRVAVQVKRYQVNHKIDVVPIRALRGALTEHSAIQGVFITTSDFTKQAIETATNHQPLIKLVSGEVLVDDLIEKRIGIIKDQYGLIHVDEEYFQGFDPDL